MDDRASRRIPPPERAAATRCGATAPAVGGAGFDVDRCRHERPSSTAMGESARALDGRSSRVTCSAWVFGACGSQQPGFCSRRGQARGRTRTPATPDGAAQDASGQRAGPSLQSRRRL